MAGGLYIDPLETRTCNKSRVLLTLVLHSGQRYLMLVYLVFGPVRSHVLHVVTLSRHNIVFNAGTVIGTIRPWFEMCKRRELVLIDI